jgi:hypothetical protein
VQDTGKGISPERLAQLFQPLAKGGESLQGTREDFGTGLTLARQLAELMGGQITARSEVGKGSVFNLELPLKVAKKVE